MRAKMDIIMPTCDLYRNITRPVLYSLEKYYADMGRIIVVGYKAPDFTLPPNCRFVSVGEDRTPSQWTNGVRRFLDGYESDYFILHMDDHLLVDYVESKTVDKLGALMEEIPGIDKIMLHPFTSTMFAEYPSPSPEISLFKCERGIGATTLMNAIWRRRYFLDVLKDDLSPHGFENQNNYNSYDDKCILSTHNRIMMVTSLMNGGARNLNWNVCRRSEFEFTVSDAEYVDRVNAMLDIACPS